MHRPGATSNLCGCDRLTLTIVMVGPLPRQRASQSSNLNPSREARKISRDGTCTQRKQPRVGVHVTTL